MSLFNLDNDRGVYTPAAREIYFNQISPQSSSLTSNIQFTFNPIPSANGSTTIILYN